MAYTKITNADTTGKGVVGLPQKPALSYSQMQEKFDQLVNDVIIPKFNDLSEELDNSVGNINEITVATTDWVSNTHATYTKKAVIASTKFSDTFIPASVDLIPSDGSAFFSDGENTAMSLLNQNIEFSDTDVTFYAKRTPSGSLKCRIRGGDE